MFPMVFSVAQSLNLKFPKFPKLVGAPKTFGNFGFPCVFLGFSAEIQKKHMDIFGFSAEIQKKHMEIFGFSAENMALLSIILTVADMGY